MDSCSNSSEFGSDDEDAEFALYSKLYFEPNEELDKVESLSTGNKNEIPKGITGVTLYQRTQTQQSSLPLMQLEVAKKIPLTSKSGLSATLPLTQDNHKTKTISQINHKKENSPFVMQLPQKRKRNTSICSVESISGKIPLDNLYCNVMDSLDEDEEEYDEEPLIVHTVKKNATRRRDIYKISSCNSGDDDSRCQRLEKLEKKKTGTGKLKNAEKTSESGKNSNGTRKQAIKKRKKVEEVCLDSDSSDSCISSLPQGKKDVRVIHNDHQKMKADTDLIQDRNSHLKSAEISENTKLQKRKGVVVVTEMNDDNPETCQSPVIVSSETDSEDDLQHLEAVPKLTMNYDQSNFKLIDTPSCSKWTSEMSRFYDSPSLDHFDVEEIHSQQSDDRKCWNILASDVYVHHRRRYYTHEPRCERCRQFGHTVKQCPRVPHCFLCAATDHTQRRDCPKNCCFRCGGSPHKFCSVTALSVVCFVCGKTGHTDSFCPDLWRRFHATTSGTVPLQPDPFSNNLQTDKRRQFCSYCGKRGHYGFQCLSARSNPKFGYSILEQSVFSYSEPVVEVDGNLILNGEDVVVNEEATKLPINVDEVGKVIGKGGRMINNISKETGVRMHVVEDGGKNYVQIVGNSKARNVCRNAIQNLLGHNIWDPTSSPTMKKLSKNTKRNAVLSCLRKKFKDYRLLRKKLPELPKAVNVLKQAQKMNGRTHLSATVFANKTEKALAQVSGIVVGHLKRGEGQNIFDHIMQIFNNIRKLGKKQCVPIHVLKDIACMFEKVDNPHLGQLNEILSLAECYLQNRDDGLSKICDNSRNNVPYATINIESNSHNMEEKIICTEVINISDEEKKSNSEGVDNELSVLLENAKCDGDCKGSLDDRKVAKLVDSKVSSFFPELIQMRESLLSNRKRENVLSVLRNRLVYIKNLKKRLPELPKAVRILSRVKKRKLRQESFSLKLSVEVKKSLTLVSLLIFGHLEFEKGKSISDRLAQLLLEVQLYKRHSVIPDHIIMDIIENICTIDNPRVENMSEILSLAQRYLKSQNGLIKKKKSMKKLQEVSGINGNEKLVNLPDDVNNELFPVNSSTLAKLGKCKPKTKTKKKDSKRKK